jgi:predicted nucleotidyltransferase
MRSDLDLLPPAKQRELERVVQIIFEEFEDALLLSSTTSGRKKGRIQKIILYGSYARGTWVDEPHTANGYQSDYDLLVSQQELAWLGEQVEELGRVVHAVCSERIAELENTAREAS